MFDRLKRLYTTGKIGDTELQNAVALGWITEEQYALIVGTPTTPP
jgi:hypothetical protein